MSRFRRIRPDFARSGSPDPDQKRGFGNPLRAFLRPVRLPITIVLLAFSLLVAACGPSADVAGGPAGGPAGGGDTGAAARLNKQGNKAFAEGTYDQALTSYRKAQEKAPELAEPYYNGSNALYRQGAYPEAGEQMKQ